MMKKLEGVVYFECPKQNCKSWSFLESKECILKQIECLDCSYTWLNPNHMEKKPVQDFLAKLKIFIISKKCPNCKSRI